MLRIPPEANHPASVPLNFPLFGIDPSISANRCHEFISVLRAARGEVLAARELKPYFFEWHSSLHKLPNLNVNFMIAGMSAPGHNMQGTRKTLRGALLSASLLILCASGAAAQDEDESSLPPPPESAEAAFNLYCAPCHGEDGRGNGPLVFGLSKSPPDLTTLAARNGGTFPRARLARLIDGRDEIDAHGNREMPIWGNWFKQEDDEAEIGKRIADLLDVLESFQEPQQ
jgi:hypothetical protein